MHVSGVRVELQVQVSDQFKVRFAFVAAAIPDPRARVVDEESVPDVGSVKVDFHNQNPEVNNRDKHRECTTLY